VHPQHYSFLDLSATALKLDVGQRCGWLLRDRFRVSFIDMFDNIGTLVAVVSAPVCSTTPT